MVQQKIKASMEQLVGKTLQKFNLACEMMMFNFEGVCIHAQCFTRILYKNDILLTTLDYQNWDGVTDTNNDEWYNLELHKDKIINNKIEKIEFTPTNDLLIWLENDIRIQMFISNGTPHYGEDNEQWRFFIYDDEQQPHTVIYSQTIESHS